MATKSMSLWDHIEVCYNLTLELFAYLRKGAVTWIYMLARLILFTFILTPAWINLLWYWFFSRHVVRNISYSSFASHNRNLLDIYLPDTENRDREVDTNNSNKKQRRKVIIFFSGGAWVIGYKLWVATCAYVYTQLGYIVVAPDYRNFPQGDIEDMVVDSHAAVEWTIANIDSFGGDSDRVILAGQSAGAQISLCMLVQEYSKSKANIKKVKKSGKKVDDDVGVSNTINILNHISMYVGISGPYNLESLSNHLNRRGLSSSLLEGIFRNDLAIYSPTAMLAELVHGSWSFIDTPHSTPARRPTLEKESSERTWRESDSPMSPKANQKATTTTKLSDNKRRSTELVDFPPVLLYHGMKDHTIPYRQCSELGDVLRAGGARVRVVLVPDWSHTDSILESPLSGDASMASDIDRYYSLLLNETAAQTSSVKGSWLPTNSVVDVLFRKPSASTSSRDNNTDCTTSTPVKSQKQVTSTYSSVSSSTTTETSAVVSRDAFSGSVTGIPPARVRHSFTEKWVVQLAKPFNPF